MENGKFRCRIKAELGAGGARGALVFAAIFLCICGCVRFATGNSYTVVYWLRARGMVPPVFLTTLLVCLSFVYLGGVFGLCMCGGNRTRDAEKYKGGMLFVLLTVLEFVWCTAFFARAATFVSLLMMLGCIVLCIGVFACFRKVSTLCGIAMALHLLWLLYLTVLNCVALFTF